MTLLLLTASPATLFAQVCTSDPTPVIANSGNAWVTDGTKLNGAFFVVASGNYAYVASMSGSSFTVVDISNPLAPAIANSGNAWITDATKLNTATSLALSGNYAYVTSYSGDRLTVIDISNPLVPVIANSGNAFVTGTRLDGAASVAISGNYAFVANYDDDSLTVVDISNPLVPVIANSGNANVRNLTKLNGLSTVKISGNYAYVAATLNNSLTVVDISNPLVPVIANGENAFIQDATKLNRPQSLAISGNYAYVVSSNGDSFTVIDISNPLVPVIANSGNAWITDGTKLNGAQSVAISGDYAYVASNNGDSLTVIDVSDPLNPVIAASGNSWITDGTKLNGPYSISLSNDYAFIASATSNSFTTIDLQCGGSGMACDADYEAVMLYNEDEGILQYCNSTDWIDMGPKDDSAGTGGPPPPNPCDTAPAVGTVCGDGTVYAGLSSDGNVPMFAARCDQGMTWNGTACTGTNTALAWNNGNTSGYTSIAAAHGNYTDGNGNTAAIVATDSDSITGGSQPHLAAKDCDDLNLNGHTDWYLPARDEMNALRTNRVAIANFDLSGNYPGGWYWCSTQNGISEVVSQRFSTGAQVVTSTKDTARSVRCVRQGALSTSAATGGGGGTACTSPDGVPGEVDYNYTQGVMQYCNGTNWINMGPIIAGFTPPVTAGIIATIPAVGAQNGGTTAAVDTTGADLIVLAITNFAMSAAPTLTDSKGNTWTSLTAYNNGTNNGRLRIYYAFDPVVGTGHTFTVAGGASYSSVGGVAFSGYSGGSFDLQQSGADNGVTTNLTLQPGSITPTVNNALIISATNYNENGTSSIDSSFIEGFDTAPVSAQSFGTTLSYLMQTTAAAVNPTITTTSTVGQFITTTIASFKPGAGGGSPDPCSGTPAIGTMCTDGTVYAGLSPDGNVPMFAKPCDEGMTWDSGSSTCTGTRTGIPWKDASGSGHIATGITSTTDGDGNTAALVLADANTAGGFQNHMAAKTCADSTDNGYSDWYLPAEQELGVLYTNQGAIGGFDGSGAFPTGWVWSSTEADMTFARRYLTNSATPGNRSKQTNITVRCVRQSASFPSGGSGSTCSNPDGVAGEMVYNDDESVMQYCNGVEWIGIR